MGREVEQILKDRGHEILCRVDAAPGVGDHTEVSPEILKGAEAIIEFSLPEAVEANIKIYAQTRTPVVVGTTGWDEHKPQLGTLIEKSQGALVYGSNFSVGAHLFFHFAEQASQLINEILDYDIMVTEWHHRLKKDSPSGTALTTAERILGVSKRKTKLETGRIDGEIPLETLHVASVRGGSIPGIHSVLLDSPADSIEIRHTARGRMGFALGAVMAAEWLQGKTGFFSVDHFMQDFLSTSLRR